MGWGVPLPPLTCFSKVFIFVIFVQLIMSCAGSNSGYSGGCGAGNSATNPGDGDYGHSDDVCGHCDSWGFSACNFSVQTVGRPEVCKISPAGQIQPVKAYDSTCMSFLSDLWKYCENLSVILFCGNLPQSNRPLPQHSRSRQYIYITVYNLALWTPTQALPN
jgi:hypothetical protein